MSKREEPTTSFALMKAALRELLETDSPEIPEEIREDIIDVFFEGKFYICYDSENEHIEVAPTPKLEAEMQKRAHSML